MFAVKGSRYLTHMKELKDPQEPLARLMERIAGPEEKEGRLLFQLPPTWPLNLSRLDGFLEALAPSAPLRVALECRHQSWLTRRCSRGRNGRGWPSACPSVPPSRSMCGSRPPGRICGSMFSDN